MATLSFSISKNETTICKFGYCFLDVGLNEIYLYDIEIEQEISLKKSEFIRFNGYANGSIFVSYELFLLRKSKLCSSRNCVLLKCRVEDFSEPDYYPYDQNLIDLFFLWDKNDDKFNSSRKKQWLYTFATMIYSSGIPIELPTASSVSIQGDKIDTQYEFFNILAELLLGKRRYLGNNLDALADSLKRSNLDMSTNNNIIEICKYDILKIQLDSCSEGYLDKIVEILVEYGFTVRKKL